MQNPQEFIIVVTTHFRSCRMQSSNIDGSVQLYSSYKVTLRLSLSFTDLVCVLMALYGNTPAEGLRIAPLDKTGRCEGCRLFSGV